MNTEPNQEKALFNEALELPEAERAAYLKGACRGDNQLLARVERLLAVQERSEALLRSGPQAAQLPTETSVTESVGTVIGRYKLLQKIGEGGCGLVYLAEQKEPVQRRVAVKVCPRSSISALPKPRLDSR
jgi:eukaryotic-like serine/threonine-protein kinase